jgi:glucans biosynthesis protein C
MQIRRYDIDALRIIAICLLIVYHTAVVFQPWGKYIGFITNNSPWPEIWQPMSAINIWRIPVLFIIAGMALQFSHRNKHIKHLLADKFKRIVIPLLTGIAFVVPAYIYVFQYYYNWPFRFSTHASHLWFLVVVFLCLLLILPLIYLLKKYQSHASVSFVIRFISSPWVMPVVILSYILESVLVKPVLFELYANTWHGFALGLLGLIWGYLFAIGDQGFAKMLSAYRWFLLIAVILTYTGRMYFEYRWPVNVLKPVESCLWIFTLLAFSYRHFNVPGRFVRYISKAAYPVYIVHLLFLGLACVVVLPLNLSNPVKYLLLLLLTFAGSVCFFEFVVKRIRVLRFLFGLNNKTESNK